MRMRGVGCEFVRGVCCDVGLRAGCVAAGGMHGHRSPPTSAAAVLWSGRRLSTVLKSLSAAARLRSVRLGGEGGLRLRRVKEREGCRV